MPEPDLRANYNTEMAALTNDFRGMLAVGASREDMLTYIHQARATTSGPWTNPLNAIQVVRVIYGIDLKDALDIICADPTWREEAGHILS